MKLSVVTADVCRRPTVHEGFNLANPCIQLLERKAMSSEKRFHGVFDGPDQSLPPSASPGCEHSAMTLQWILC